MPFILCALLAYTDPVVDAASGEEELSRKVCEIVETAAIFKSDVWENFGFPMSGNNEREKAAGGQKTICTRCTFLHVL